MILEVLTGGFGLYVVPPVSPYISVSRDKILTPFLPKVLANLLALAGVCPFVGSLSDLIGRRYVAIIGAFLVCIGMIVSSTANTMNTFIGMTR